MRRTVAAMPSRMVSLSSMMRMRAMAERYHRAGRGGAVLVSGAGMRAHEGVVLAFVLDGRFRAVARDHACLAGKDVQLGANGSRQIGKRSARKIRTPDGFGKQSISREQNGIAAAEEEADRAGCVPRGVQDLNG